MNWPALGYPNYEMLRKDVVSKRVPILIKKGYYDQLILSLDTFKTMVSIAAIIRVILPMLFACGYCLWIKDTQWMILSIGLVLVMVVPPLPTLIYITGFTIGLIMVMLDGPIVITMVLIGLIGVPIGNTILQTSINYSVFRLLIRNEASFERLWQTDAIYSIINGQPKCASDM